MEGDDVDNQDGSVRNGGGGGTGCNGNGMGSSSCNGGGGGRGCDDNGMMGCISVGNSDIGCIGISSTSGCVCNTGPAGCGVLISTSCPGKIHIMRN